MNDLTPDSVAVRLYAAMHRQDDIDVAVNWLNSDYHNARVQRATWNAVAAEHERLCSDRIAAAEKAARLKALEEAIRVVAEEHLDGFWEPVRDHADEAYDKAIDHAYDAISALITAAEAQPGAKT